MKPPVLRRGYAPCRFGQLHYMQGAPEHAEAAPLVLLHQTPSSIAEFIPFAQEMVADRQVIAFDTPGFGMSDPPPAPLSMADYAAAFADALDALSLAGSRRLDLLGYHTGAYLAAELAIARPDLIGRLVLCGIPFRPADERAAKLAASASPPAATEETVFTFIRTLWDFTVLQRPGATTLTRALQLFADRIRAMERAAWPYEGVWRYDAERRFARLTQPVLVLQPHDPLFGRWRTPIESLPHATVLEFPHLDKDVFDLGGRELARALRGWTAPSDILETSGGTPP